MRGRVRGAGEGILMVKLEESEEESWWKLFM